MRGSQGAVHPGHDLRVLRAVRAGSPAGLCSLTCLVPISSRAAGESDGHGFHIHFLKLRGKGPHPVQTRPKAPVWGLLEVLPGWVFRKDGSLQGPG